MLSIKIMNSKNECAASAEGEEEVNLYFAQEYNEGDIIYLDNSDNKPYFVWLQVDDALGKSLLYVKNRVRYIVPFNEKRDNLSPKAFSGDCHLLSARIAADYEVSAYRNLAVNVNDQHENTTSFPHASANVETRGESVFAAANAIDGITINHCHGKWPFESWGIDRRDDAALKIDFGRTVEADKIKLYTRSDFPHDNWWKMVRIRFSDGSMMQIPMEKGSLPHEITFNTKKISWVVLDTLEKADDPSPFPALTQIQVYGKF